jgi:uncharacterized protein YqgV (UPF0045/DUF77 family)
MSGREKIKISVHFLSIIASYLQADVVARSDCELDFHTRAPAGKEINKMNASVAIQTLPEAKNDEELIRIVDEVIAYIKSTGLNYYVGPFETAIEGDYDELMDIVKECQHIAIRAGAPSVAAYIKVSYRPEGDVLTIEKKVTKHHQN